MTVYNDTVTDTANHADASSWVRRLTGIILNTYNADTVLSHEYKAMPTIVDVPAISHNVFDSSTVLNILSDVFNVTDKGIAPYFEIVLDALNALDVSTYDAQYYVSIADTLVINGLVPNRIVGLNTILDVLNSVDSISRALGATAFDSFNVVDIHAEKIRGHIVLIESLLASSSSSYIGGIFITLTENVIIDDTVSVQQILKAFLNDVVFLGGTFDTDGDLYTFVLNTENEAITRYDNFNFNSISGNLGAMPNGIYELSGPDDSGTEINAHFTTGLMDFGSSIHKQCPYAYIGLASDGELILKTVTEQHGKKNERWYKFSKPKTALDTVRVQLGRGVKSRYWQYEISNASGADFDIDTIELLPLVLKRRV
jgi:hypothetical protein